MKPEYELSGLTKPQWTVLSEVVDGRLRTVGDCYKTTIVVLIKRNLIEWETLGGSEVRATNTGYSLVMDTRRKLAGGGE